MADTPYRRNARPQPEDRAQQWSDWLQHKAARKADPAGLPALREAIRHLHGCESHWVESVAVYDTHEGRTVWEGEVQVFKLVGHREAARAYAWSTTSEGGLRRFHVVPELAPVDSPVMAVRTVLLADRAAKRSQR